MRILLVSQMYPGPTDPDLGIFVAGLERELRRQGHEVDRAVLDARGGPRTKYLRLAADAVRGARRRRPDVVYAHFLVPTGLIGALAGAAGRAPLVVTAHGTDVANIGRIRGIEAATRLVVRRAAATIAVSRWLADRLEQRVAEARGAVEVVNCGVDLGAFSPADAAAARAEVGWDGEAEGATGPRYLCVGTLDERKNVVRLADAFARLGEGELAFVGDGPLRGQLEGRPGVRVVGRVPQPQVARWIAAADVVCQPSLVEPFGQATLEAMAAGRSVVATSVGGPPEFVPPEAGVLVDPRDTVALADALRAARRLPVPNHAARAAAEAHDVRVQAARVAAILERAVADRS